MPDRSNVRWLLQRIALLDSPLVMIAAVAGLFTGRATLSIALALLGFGLYMLGRPALGQKRPPAPGERGDAGPSRRRGSRTARDASGSRSPRAGAERDRPPAPGGPSTPRGRRSARRGPPL
ncbi:MAG TPA: hypothetical protein VF520_11130 [Thermoleophilaceae bacterium]